MTNYFLYILFFQNIEEGKGYKIALYLKPHQLGDLKNAFEVWSKKKNAFEGADGNDLVSDLLRLS